MKTIKAQRSPSAKKKRAAKAFAVSGMFAASLLAPKSLRAENLTLDQALKEASHDSLEVQVSEATRDSSRWGVTEATAPFLPSVNLDAQHYFDIKYQTLNIAFAGQNINFPLISPQTTYLATVNWNIFNGLQDLNKMKAARYKKQAAERDYEWTHFQVDQEVRLAFFEVIAARQLEDVANANVDNLETHLKQVDDMMHAGEAIRVDVLRVQVQLNNARAQKINAHDNVVISQQKLAQSLGKATESRTVNGSLPVPDTAVAAKIESSAAYEKSRFADRGDLEATDLRSQAAEKMEAASDNWWVPSLSVVGNYQYYDNENYAWASSSSLRSAYMYGLELKWNIFDGLLSYARAKEAAAESVRQVKSAALARLQAQTDFQTNQSEYRYQLTQYVADTDNLDRSKKSVDLALAGFRSGTQTNTDVLDAELDLFNARAGVIQSQIKALEAQVKFENSIGRKI